MPPIEAGQGPTFRSANDDLFIYLVEEAAFSLSEAVPPEADMKEVEVKLKHETALKLGSRGVHPTDVRGDMSLRRKKELEMALGRGSSGRQAHLDRSARNLHFCRASSNRSVHQNSRL